MAFFLIAILLVLVVLSALVPQKDVAQDRILDWEEFLGDGYVVIEKTGLDQIYSSPLFFLVLGLLAINLAAGNLKRIKLVFRAEKPLVKARHLGMIIFHLALLLIIAGVILNYLFRFHGVFGLTEGQTARDTEQKYFRIFAGPLYPGQFGRFAIELAGVDPVYETAGARTAAAEITLRPAIQETPITDTILINHPLAWRGLEFHFGSKTGLSPEVLVTDTSGQQIFRSFVRLSTRRVEDRTLSSDFVIIPSKNLKINVEVQSADEAIDSAVFVVAVEQAHVIVYQGTLTPVDTVAFGGLRLTIPRLRRWCYVDVVENQFLNLVFIGFWTALAGLVIGFVPRLISRRKQ